MDDIDTDDLVEELISRLKTIRKSKQLSAVEKGEIKEQLQGLAP